MMAVFSAGAVAQTSAPGPAATPPPDFDQAVDRVVQREQQFLDVVRNFKPLAETYIQNLKPDAELGAVPTSDDYFLGKLELGKGLRQRSFMRPEGHFEGLMEKLTGIFSLQYEPLGFAQMLFLDDRSFDRRHYSFTFVGREFLGEVRCLVMDVAPLANAGASRFTGRIWVEDQDYHIVRFNGAYGPHPRYGYKLEFDSWRFNPLPGLWLPSLVYVQQSDQHFKLGKKLRFKAQTRFWGYDLQHAGDHQEYTQIMVDTPVFDRSQSGEDLSPLLSQRQFQYSADENVIERLQVAGLMAPKGGVDTVLKTVVQNLVITNNLAEKLGDVRCRVLLTTPLESFAIGHTIVVSRGLLDVLPDEPTLAAILAHELAHIILGHSANLEYSFNERMFFADEQSFQKLNFHTDARREQIADDKALDLLRHSPYKDQLGSAGLFFEALEDRGPRLPNLLHAHLGNSLMAGRSARLRQLKHGAPQLATRSTDQIAALPLGGRVKLDPWSDKVDLVDLKPVPILYAGEKMPFEVTPFFPFLRRASSNKPLTAESTGSH